MFTRVSCVYLPSARVAVFSSFWFNHVYRSQAARFASTAASRQVTKLENGIRVITDNEASHAATVAVAVGGGASAQTFANNGIAHFVARSSFQVRVKWFTMPDTAGRWNSIIVAHDSRY